MSARPKPIAAPDPLDEIRDDLRALRESLPQLISDAVHEALDSHEAPAPKVGALRAEDMEDLEKLFPVLAAQFGSGSFTVAEVKERASKLNAAGQNLRLVIGHRSSRSLGKLLERAVGHDVGGLTVVRAGRDNTGTQWCCMQVIAG